MREAGVDARKKRILQAIIEDSVLTALPVGSRTISRKYETSLSSATIRNEMSDLEEMGYLAQPHVSAGRVPSHKAYRLYVDGLLQGEVRADEEMKAFFADQLRPTEDVATAAAQALAGLTRYTAVVMMPKQLELRVSCLQLVPMPRGAALLVIVTDTGAIRDTVIRVSERLDSDALFSISRLLTERLAGRTLQEVQEMLGAYARMNGPDARVLEGIASLAAQMEKQSAQDTVIVAGSHNILNYPEYSDVEKARAFLTALEEKEKLTHLLSHHDAPFMVHIGSESAISDMQDCAIVTAGFPVGRGHRGAVGVIGPSRMPYEKVLSALGAASHVLGELLGE